MTGGQESEKSPQRVRAEEILEQLPADPEQTRVELQAVGRNIQGRFAERARQLDTLGYFPTQRVIRYGQDWTHGDQEGQGEGVKRVAGLYVTGTGGDEYGPEEAVVMGRNGRLHAASLVQTYGGGGRGLRHESLKPVALDQYPQFEASAYRQIKLTLEEQSGITAERVLAEDRAKKQAEQRKWNEDTAKYRGRSDLVDSPDDIVGLKATLIRATIGSIIREGKSPEVGMTPEQLANVFVHMFLAYEYEPEEGATDARYGSKEVIYQAGNFIGKVHSDIGEEVHLVGRHMMTTPMGPYIRVARSLGIPQQVAAENEQMYELLMRQAQKVGKLSLTNRPPSYAPFNPEEKIGDEEVSLPAQEVLDWFTSQPTPKVQK